MLRFLFLSLAGTVAALVVQTVLQSILALAAGVLNLARRQIGSALGGFFHLVGVFLIFKLDKVGHVKKRVAFETDIDKCRLHAGEHAGYAAVIDGPREGIFVFAFVINLRELIVFKNCKPRFVRSAGDTNFLCHRTFPPASSKLRVLAARSALEMQIRQGKE